MRPLAAVLVLLACALPARAQVGGCADLDRLNRRLAGRVVDFTHNHGEDRRVFSPILGRPRDLYVYLPPGYTPAAAYPLILYLHMGYVDEVLVGREIVTRLPEIVRTWVDLERARRNR